MSALPKKLYTLEEYLELDKHSDERFECFDETAFLTPVFAAYAAADFSRAFQRTGSVREVVRHVSDG